MTTLTKAALFGVHLVERPPWTKYMSPSFVFSPFTRLLELVFD